MPTRLELDELAKILNQGGPKYEPGDYSVLADESDEHGMVNVCGKNGHVKMTMPRSVWDALREQAVASGLLETVIDMV